MVNGASLSQNQEKKGGAPLNEFLFLGLHSCFLTLLGWDSYPYHAIIGFNPFLLQNKWDIVSEHFTKPGLGRIDPRLSQW